MKLKISWITVLLWLVALLNGSSKAMFYLFSMMTLHEAAHCLLAAFFKLKIEQVSIYPFGLCAQMPNLRYQSCLTQLCVLMAGPMVHLIIPLILRQLYHMDILSLAFMQWCLMMNWQILLFNCLPILPLDGGGICFALLGCFFPYRKTTAIMQVFTAFFAIGLFLFIFPQNIASFIICLLILLISLRQLLHLNEIFHDACLYRLLQVHNYPNHFHNKNDFYLFYHNLYPGVNRVLDEKEWLWQFLGKNESQKKNFMV